MANSLWVFLARVCPLWWHPSRPRVPAGGLRERFWVWLQVRAYGK